MASAPSLVWRASDGFGVFGEGPKAAKHLHPLPEQQHPHAGILLPRFKIGHEARGESLLTLKPALLENPWDAKARKLLQCTAAAPSLHSRGCWKAVGVRSLEEGGSRQSPWSPQSRPYKPQSPVHPHSLSRLTHTPECEDHRLLRHATKMKEKATLKHSKALIYSRRSIKPSVQYPKNPKHLSRPPALP